MFLCLKKEVHLSSLLRFERSFLRVILLGGEPQKLLSRMCYADDILGVDISIAHSLLADIQATLPQLLGYLLIFTLTKGLTPLICMISLYSSIAVIWLALFYTKLENGSLCHIGRIIYSIRSVGYECERCTYETPRYFHI